MNKWLIFFCLITISACHTHKQTLTESPAPEDSSPIDSIAKDRFGDNYFIVYNETNRYALIKSKTKKFSEIGFDITFLLIDNQSKEIILEDFLKSGHVDWIDENTIKAVNRKLVEGNKRSKEVYTYNAKTREKVEL